MGIFGAQFFRRARIVYFRPSKIAYYSIRNRPNAFVGELNFVRHTDIIRRKAPCTILAWRKHGVKKTPLALPGCVFLRLVIVLYSFMERLLAQRTVRTRPLYEEANVKQ